MGTKPRPLLYPQIFERMQRGLYMPDDIAYWLSGSKPAFARVLLQHYDAVYNTVRQEQDDLDNAPWNRVCWRLHLIIDYLQRVVRWLNVPTED